MKHKDNSSIDKIFWDTSGFFSLVNLEDPAHPKAQKILESCKKDKIQSATTDWVVGETCTLLGARKRGHLILPFLDSLLNSAAITRVHLNPEMIAKGEEILRRSPNRGFSFVDCLSFAFMKNQKISRVVSTDNHFKEFGYIVLL